MDLGLRLACKATLQRPKPYAFSEYGSFQEEDIRIGSKGLKVAEPGQDEVSYSGICLDDLEFSTVTLGAGSSGVVKQAIHVPTGTLLAVKVISLNLEEGERRKALQELRSLHKCNHPNIVEFMGAFYREGSISILLEFMDVGALDCLLQISPTMPEEVIGQLAAGIVSAMAYIHKELHIVHRDIKPSNVLVNSAGEVKLSDFGVSGKLANTMGQATTFAGTVTFMSPERIKGDAHSSTSDVWSLGVTLLQCALGRFPYFDEHESCGSGITFFDLLERIQNRPAPLPPSSFSEEFCDFITECLKKDPLKRPSAVQLLEHAFIVRHSVGSDALVAWIYDTVKNAGKSEEERRTPPRPSELDSPQKHEGCPAEVASIRTERAESDKRNLRSDSSKRKELRVPEEFCRASSDQSKMRVSGRSSSSSKKKSRRKGREKDKDRGAEKDGTEDKEKKKENTKEKGREKKEKRDRREKRSFGHEAESKDEKIIRKGKRNHSEDREKDKQNSADREERSKRSGESKALSHGKKDREKKRSSDGKASGRDEKDRKKKKRRQKDMRTL